jgi:hypothetical protein
MVTFVFLMALIDRVSQDSLDSDALWQMTFLIFPESQNYSQSKTALLGPGMMASAYNLSYTGARDEKIMVLGQPWQKKKN